MLFPLSFSLFLCRQKISFLCKEITIGVFIIAHRIFQQHHQIFPFVMKVVHFHVRRQFPFVDHQCPINECFHSLQFMGDQNQGFFPCQTAGKSTLLRLMAGLLVQKDSGCQILLDGKPATEVRGEVACIFEEGTFLPDLTPKQYGDFLADFFPKFDRAYYEKLVKFFKLEEKAAKHMSRGQKAKLEIAAGLAKQTKYIFMDEPFLGKDALTRQDFMKILSGSLTGEETLILVTNARSINVSTASSSWVTRIRVSSLSLTEPIMKSW